MYIDENNAKIEENLVFNLVRLFTAYGWFSKDEPENFYSKYVTVTYYLYHGGARAFLKHLDNIIAARSKDHKWGLYTSTFVKGVRDLLKIYSHTETAKGIKLINYPLIISDFKSRGKFEEIPAENIFENIDYATEAIDRLDSFGKTNIRYWLIEKFGEERVLKDLRKVRPYAKLSVHYDEHQPDQFREWLYFNGKTKMTVMYPVMPLVYITLDN